MTPEMQQDIEELKQAGWQADDATRALEYRYRFADYGDTLTFMIAIGEAAEEFEVMPAVRIDSGTEVAVRIGREPAPPLTADEIGFAKALAAAA
jgi:pterin-4a-carbinolamine dehydratase